MIYAVKVPEILICPNCQSTVKNKGKKVFRCPKCGKIIDLKLVVW